jgi:hypothetical protein
LGIRCEGGCGQGGGCELNKVATFHGILLIEGLI